MDTFVRTAFAFLRMPDDFASMFDAVRSGGAASLNGALIGSLVGAYSGMAGIERLPKWIRDGIQSGARIETMVRRLVKTAIGEEFDV